MIAVSVLIPSITERLGVAGELLAKLHAQSSALPDVAQAEIICVTDNRKIPLRIKRNTMLRLASGIFVIHLDDDDDVSEDFLPEVCAAAVHHPTADVICYDQMASLDGENPFRVSTSLDFENEEARKDGEDWVDIRRKPWHWCAWNRKITKTGFKSAPNEDWLWIKKCLRLAKTEHRIPKTLHFYRWSSTGTTFT